MATYSLNDVPTAEFETTCQSIRQQFHCPNCGEIVTQKLAPNTNYKCPKCNKVAESQILERTAGHLSYSKLVELSRIQVPWATAARWGDIHFDPAKFVPREAIQKLFDHFRTNNTAKDRCLFVLLGENGYGKTWLTASWAHNLVARKQPVFFCDLRDGLEPFLRIVFGCKKENFTKTLNDITGTIVKPIVWIFDAYDDCTSESECTAVVGDFLRFARGMSKQHRSHLVVLTSRPHEWLIDRSRFNVDKEISEILWREGGNDGIPATTVLPRLSPNEIALIAEKYHLPPPGMWSGALRNLADNPLWICFASELYRLKKVMPDVVDPQLYLKFFARLGLQPTDLEALGEISLHLLAQYPTIKFNGNQFWMKKFDRLDLPEIDFLTLLKLESVGLITLSENEIGSQIALTNPHHAWFSIAYRIYQLSKTDREDQLIPIYKQLESLPDRESILHIAWALSVEIPEVPGVEDIPMVSYNGIALRAGEYQVMAALEKQIGKPIPFLERVEWNTFGFSATSGHVRALNVCNQGLITLPSNFGELTYLQRSWFAGNQLTELPVSFGNLRSLRKLNLVNNTLTSLPNTFGDLPLLEKVSLGKNQLTNLPEQIGRIQTLEKLSLNDNKLQKLPNGIGNLRNLKELDLSHNQLTELPEKIGNLPVLEYLDLSFNQLTKLQDTIGDIETLKELMLTHNNLKVLSESLTYLYLLQKLDLSHNQITELPSSFGDLELIEILDLSSNALRGIPNSIENMEYLKICKLSENKLETLPETIGKLSSLQSLYLQHNSLAQLPSSLGDLDSLLELDLSFNNLQGLPQTIEKLHSLQVFVLSNNQLTTLPDAFCVLNSLSFLYLSNNRLSSLPEQFPRLQSLQHIDLRNNRFTSEPALLQNMKTLKSILMEGNPL